MQLSRMGELKGALKALLLRGVFLFGPDEV